jgi:hypothetical protein
MKGCGSLEVGANSFLPKDADRCRISFDGELSTRCYRKTGHIGEHFTSVDQKNGRLPDPTCYERGIPV